MLRDERDVLRCRVEFDLLPVRLDVLQGHELRDVLLAIGAQVLRRRKRLPVLLSAKSQLRPVRLLRSSRVALRLRRSVLQRRMQLLHRDVLLEARARGAWFGRFEGVVDGPLEPLEPHLESGNTGRVRRLAWHHLFSDREVHGGF
jgi:hypothetical protein